MINQVVIYQLQGNQEVIIAIYVKEVYVLYIYLKKA